MTQARLIADGPDVVRFTIPGLPVRKGEIRMPVALKPKQGKRWSARLIDTPAYRQFRRTVQTIAFQESLPEIRDGNWEITVRSYWSKQRHLDVSFPFGDSDASIEPVRDALQHAGVLDDDVRVTRSIGESHYSKTNPRIEVELRRLS